MSFINGFLIICFTVFFVFLLGLYNFIVNRGENECTMTYMFEYPQYVRISLPESARRFKSYGLYAYGEGRFTEKVRDMKFSGIPVLFIHGHRGSYKQMRSLASVSLRKSLGSKSPFHFDYFAVDLNEEYSGLYGGLLRVQTDFVKIAVDRILSLYRSHDSPDSVIVVAHSMGGLIAKGLFVADDLMWSKVRLIVTLATPHQPAVILDSQMADYYSELSELWDAPPIDLRSSLTLVSIGGGPRDVIVHSSLTLTPHADLSIAATGISDVWLSTDHVCILWCKELVLVLVRSLFDSIDFKRKQLSKDPDHVKSVFDYHLIERSAGKWFNGSAHPVEVPLWRGEHDGGAWLRLRKAQLTWKKENLSVVTHIVVSLSATLADGLAISTIGHSTADWLFACRADAVLNNVKICSRGENLSTKGRIAPTKDFKRKTAVIDLTKLRLEGKTHVVIRTLPTDDPVQISFDLFRMAERTIIGEAGFLKGQEVVSGNVEGAVYYKIILPDLSKPWHTFLLASRGNCSSSSLSQVKVNIPWNNEQTQVLLKENNDVARILLYSSKPSKKDTNDAYVEVYLNGECSVSLKLEKSMLLSLSNLISRNYASLTSFMAVCLLMTLAQQIKLLKEEGECPLIHNIMPQAAKPYYIMPSANIAGAFARYLPHMAGMNWVPFSDVHHHSGLVDSFYIPLLLHCSAVAVVYLLGIGVVVAVVFQGQAFNGYILKFISKFCLGLPWLSEYIMAGFNKLPLIVSAIMVAISYSACAGLAVYLGLVFYFIKLISLYEDFWEEIVYWPMRTLKAIVMANRFTKRKLVIPKFEIPPLKDLSFHLTIFMMWFIIALICTPSVLVWARNYRYQSFLDRDPFCVVGMVLSICGGYLWQAEAPRVNLKYSDEVRRVLLGCCVVILVYGQWSLQRMITVLTGAIAIVAVHQLVAPSLGELGPADVGPLTQAADSLARRIAKLLGGEESPPDSPALPVATRSAGSSSEDQSEQCTSQSATSSECEERWPAPKDLAEIDALIASAKEAVKGISNENSPTEGPSEVTDTSVKNSSSATSDPIADCGDIPTDQRGDNSPSSDISVSSFENILISDVKSN